MKDFKEFIHHELIDFQHDQNAGTKKDADEKINSMMKQWIRRSYVLLNGSWVDLNQALNKLEKIEKLNDMLNENESTNCQNHLAAMQRCIDKIQ